MTNSTNSSTSAFGNEIIDVTSDDNAPQREAPRGIQRYSPVPVDPLLTTATASSVQSIRDNPQKGRNLEKKSNEKSDASRDVIPQHTGGENAFFDDFNLNLFSTDDMHGLMDELLGGAKRSGTEAIKLPEKRSFPSADKFWKTLKKQEPLLHERHFQKFVSNNFKASSVRLAHVQYLLELNPRPANLDYFLNERLGDFIRSVGNAGTNFKYRDEFLVELFTAGAVNTGQAKFLVDENFKALIFPRVGLSQQKLYTFKAVFTALEENNRFLNKVFVQHKDTIEALAGQKAPGSYVERVLFLCQLAIRCSTGKSVNSMVTNVRPLLGQGHKMQQEIKTFLLSSGFDEFDLPSDGDLDPGLVDALVKKVYLTLSRIPAKNEASPFTRMTFRYSDSKLAPDARSRFMESMEPIKRSIIKISPIYSKMSREGRLDRDHGADQTLGGEKRGASALSSTHSPDTRQVRQRTFFDSPLYAAASQLEGVFHYVNPSSGVSAEEARDMMTNMMRATNCWVVRGSDTE